MNENKKEKAGRIFDAVGTLDDYYITEAASYKKKKNFFERNFPYFAYAAAVLAVIFLISPAVRLFVGNDKTSGTPVDRSYVGRLGGQLTALNAEYSPCSAESIDLFDGKKKIVWQTAGEDFYRTSEIKASEVELEKKLSSYAAKIPPEIKDYSPEVYVWITLGDGRVISPYLAYTSGNVGYGEIFDYEPEIIPTDSFSLFIENQLEN